jgi:hypothetical protein
VMVCLARAGLFDLDGSGHCKGEVELSEGVIARALGLSKSTVYRALRFWSENWRKRWRESGVIPDSCQIRVRWHESFYEDEAVRYSDTHDPLTRVDGDPGAGQYRVSAGVYCFAPADRGRRVTWRYKYGPEQHGLGIIRIAEQPGDFDSDGNWKQPPNKIIYLPGRVLDHDQACSERDRFLAAGASMRNNAWWKQIDDIHLATLPEWENTEKTLGTLWRECRRRMHERGIPTNLIERLFPRAPA